MQAALPEVKREVLKLPRQYLCNLVYTIAGQPFEEFVAQKVRARNTKIQQE